MPDEEVERDMVSGDKEEDVYTEEGREVAEDDGAITNVDEGFMEGYEKGDSAVKCANCGKVLEEDFIEDDENKFCSEACAESFKSG